MLRVQQQLLRRQQQRAVRHAEVQALLHTRMMARLGKNRTRKEQEELAAERGERVWRRRQKEYEETCGLQPVDLRDVLGEVVGYHLPVAEALQALLLRPCAHTHLQLCVFVDSCTVERPWIVPGKYKPSITRGGLNCTMVALHVAQHSRTQALASWVKIALWYGKEDYSSLAHYLGAMGLLQVLDVIGKHPTLVEGKIVKVFWVLDLHCIISILNAFPVCHKWGCPLCAYTKTDWRQAGVWFEAADLDTLHSENLLCKGKVVYDFMHMLPNTWHNFLAAIFFKLQRAGFSENSATLLMATPRWVPPKTVKRCAKTAKKKAEQAREVEVPWRVVKKYIRSMQWWDDLRAAMPCVDVQCTFKFGDGTSEDFRCTDALCALITCMEHLMAPFHTRGYKQTVEGHKALAQLFIKLFVCLQLEPSRHTVPMHVFLMHAGMWLKEDPLPWFNEGGEHSHQPVKTVVRRHPRLYAVAGPYALRELMVMFGIQCLSEAR